MARPQELRAKRDARDNYRYARYWQDTAERRLELLRQYEQAWYWCPVCKRPDYNYEKHTDDCPVKKELSDA